MRSRLLVFTLLFCTLATLSGCASFRNNEVAQIGALPDVSQHRNKPSVFVDTHLFRGEPGTAAQEMLQHKSLVDQTVQKSLAGSGLFSKCSFNEADRAMSDYVLRVDIYNHGNDALAFAAGFISGFTFGIIPAAATDNYTLETRLADTSGKTIATPGNKDSITTWVGLWFIPMMGNTPGEAFEATIDNQLKSILKELVESGKLKYSFLEPHVRMKAA